MANINLLPWREQRRQQQRRDFIVILGCVAGLGALVVLLAHLVISSQIDHQADRNQYLQTHISELDKQVAEIRELQTRRNQLIDRMQVIQNLQGTRPLIVRIFDEIVRTLPEGVYYRSLQRTGSTITIAGTAENNNRVSSLMRQLEKSDWFANPVLKGVRANPSFGEQANDFDMTVTVTTPVVTDAQDEAGE
jgi:type IV pilus assembly protein PilN